MRGEEYSSPFFVLIRVLGFGMGFWQKLFGPKKTEVASVYYTPANERIYAVGDIHGRADLLIKLLDKIRADIAVHGAASKNTLIFLGDYVDRGFHSREVIAQLLTLDMPEAELVFLAGNHEDMVLQFLDDPANGELWLKVGGLATLASYGVYIGDESDVEGMMEASEEFAKKLPPEHLAFIQGLKETHAAGDYLFVHAGIRPAVPMDSQIREDLLGIRREFTGSGMDFGFCVVHGHTGVREPQIRKNRIAVDTGAFATGVLTAAVLHENEVNFIST